MLVGEQVIGVGTLGHYLYCSQQGMLERVVSLRQ